ncbi:flavin reductase [Synergistales bacterium]|nr:flavin reductase [Synergistales bacterium]
MAIENENAIDARALFTFSYGLYIVGTAFEGKLNAQVADAVMQITSDPIYITAALNKANYTTELVEKSRKFTVSVFSSDVEMPFIGIFGFRSGRSEDKFAKCKYRLTESGLPIVTEHVVAAVEAEVSDIIDVQTHKLVIGKVISAEVIAPGEVLTYADYHKVKKGKSPAGAPSAIFNNLK